jgi:hypothetical protein
VLPALHLDRLMKLPPPEETSFVFEILAEGYRRVVPVPVAFILGSRLQFQLDTIKKIHEIPEWL